MTIWLYTLISVFIVSLISLVGAFALAVKRSTLERVLIYLVSLSAGTLLGDAFIHLIPESYAKYPGRIWPAIWILSGIVAFFILEKFIHWRHCHKIPSARHPHPFSYVILVGDGAHNFIDGMIIAAGFLINIPVGIATTLAVIFHEIPHEIGNFGSLVYGGFTRSRALWFNFLSALASILGALVVLVINYDSGEFADFLVPFAAGGFIYIASADLIPELHKNSEPGKSFGQLLSFVAGIGLMFALLFLG